MANSETRAKPRNIAPSKSGAAKAPSSTRKPAAASKTVRAASKATPKKKSSTKKTVTKRAAKRPAKAPAKSARARGKPGIAKVLDAAGQLRALVLDALDDLKAKDVREVDVRGKSSVTDLLVVASGTSSRHVKSIAEEVVKKAKQAGQPPIGVEGQREAEWVLVDLGDVIVHVMLPRTREFYGLERLWTVGDDEAPLALAG